MGLVGNKQPPVVVDRRVIYSRKESTYARVIGNPVDCLIVCGDWSEVKSVYWEGRYLQYTTDF